MSTDLSPPSTIQTRRLYTSNVAHLINTAEPQHPEYSRPAALCGIRPFWPGEWIEVSLDGEEHTPCGNCKSRLEAMQRVSDS